MPAQIADLDCASQREIINTLCAKLRACYVYPDIAERICASLQEHFNLGDYADFTEGQFFALALTMHMQEAHPDEHLWVRWHPEALPDEDDSLRHNPKWLEERKAEASLDNFGLHKVERLPGNIGYLDIKFFHRAAWGGETVAAAMAFLANVSALIFDLRQCEGGYPGMICLVSSYLFGEEPIHLSNIYWREEDTTQQFWTLPHIPGRRFGDIPLYVLTSKATFSGGEMFASILQSRGRAVVVGQKTDGGAHPGAAYRLHPHVEAFIPLGCATNPLNGESLEGAGVTPDFDLPAEHALKAAYFMALKAVLARLGEPGKAPAGEARTALNELTGGHAFCGGCGCPNPRAALTCQHCGKDLPGAA